MRKSRTKRRRVLWCLSIATATLVFVLWAASFLTASGIGVGSTRAAGWSGGSIQGAAQGRRNVEVSLARGGLMVVLNGTRTDVIYYDDNMGCSSSDFGLFYTVQMQQVSAPYVWLPSCDKPEPWAGTYVLAPFWLLASVPLAIMCLLWLTRSPRAGHCPECGYNLRGLGAAPTCPECGATARNPRIPKPSPN